MDYAAFRDTPGFISKGEPRKRTKAREKRLKLKDTAAVRQYVFARERQIDRVTRFLRAESMHELVFRSQGGKVSRKNSIAVHGDGVRGIHGMLQRHEIGYRFEDETLGADGALLFTAYTQAAADAMRVPIGGSIYSPPMFMVEDAE